MRLILFAIAGALALAGCSQEPEGDADAQAATEEITYPGVPEEQAARIRELGREIDPASFAIFEGMVDAPPYDDVDIDADISYGEDAAQVLDVYTFQNSSEGSSRPVLLFVHGGGFVGGSKAGGYYPQNVTAWAARNGMVGVNMDYRLAPDAAWPAGRDDLAAAIAWVRQNIARYGGNPDRIVLFGHSAGANHVADYVTHKDLQGAEAGAVEGAVLLSPYYAAKAGPPDYAANAGEAADHPYYGSAEALQTASAAIARMGASSVPLFVGYAEYDPQFMVDFAHQIENELCGSGAGGSCPKVLFLADHNHLTEGASIGSADESLSGPLLAWLKSL